MLEEQVIGLQLQLHFINQSGTCWTLAYKQYYYFSCTVLLQLFSFFAMTVVYFIISSYSSYYLAATPSLQLRP